MQELVNCVLGCVSYVGTSVIDSDGLGRSGRLISEGAQAACDWVEFLFADAHRFVGEYAGSFVHGVCFDYRHGSLRPSPH